VADSVFRAFIRVNIHCPSLLFIDSGVLDVTSFYCNVTLDTQRIP